MSVSTEFVRVEPGLAADGYVAVTANDGGTLQAGDLVVVGVDPNATSPPLASVTASTSAAGTAMPTPATTGPAGG